ncbi:MAG: hypothetical protein KF726_07975 [Anaerolineae bacterium]|nr:hypothetical protein [Anaerolineae bacterium]
MNQDDQDYIENYITENRSTYTREAITAQLLKFGYSKEAIRRGWAALVVEADHDGSGGTVRKQAGENFGCGMMLTILGWATIPAILLFLGYTAVINSRFAGMDFRERYNAENVLFQDRINLLFVVLIIGVFLVAAFLRTRGWSSTRLLALGCAVTFALVFIVLGSCMVGGVRFH